MVMLCSFPELAPAWQSKPREWEVLREERGVALGLRLSSCCRGQR